MLAEPYQLNIVQSAKAAGKFQESSGKNIIVKITTTTNDELRVSETFLPQSCSLARGRTRARIAL